MIVEPIESTAIALDIYGTPLITDNFIPSLSAAVGPVISDQFRRRVDDAGRKCSPKMVSRTGYEATRAQFFTDFHYLSTFCIALQS